MSVTGIFFRFIFRPPFWTLRGRSDEGQTFKRAHAIFTGIGGPMRKTMLFVSAAAAFIALPAQASAQVSFGPELSFGTDSDLGVGARVGFGVPVGDGFFADMRIVAAFDYFLDCGGFDISDSIDCSYFEITPFARVPVEISPDLATYVGAGLNIARFSVEENITGFDFGGSDTNIGLAAVGGIEFPISSLSAFGEARLDLGGGEQLVLLFGLLLGG